MAEYLKPIPFVERYIGVCCREYILAFGYPVGRCVKCGERPRFAYKWDREVDDD